MEMETYWALSTIKVNLTGTSVTEGGDGTVDGGSSEASIRATVFLAALFMTATVTSLTTKTVTKMTQKRL